MQGLQLANLAWIRVDTETELGAFKKKRQREIDVEWPPVKSLSPSVKITSGFYENFFI